MYYLMRFSSTRIFLSMISLYSSSSLLNLLLSTTFICWNDIAQLSFVEITLHNFCLLKWHCNMISEVIWKLIVIRYRYPLVESKTDPRPLEDGRSIKNAVADRIYVAIWCISYACDRYFIMRLSDGPRSIRYIRDDRYYIIKIYSCNIKFRFRIYFL